MTREQYRKHLLLKERISHKGYAISEARFTTVSDWEAYHHRRFEDYFNYLYANEAWKASLEDRD